MKKLVVLILLLCSLLLLTVLAIFTVVKLVEVCENGEFELFSDTHEDSDDDSELEQESIKHLNEYSEIIEEYATKYDLPISLVYAVIECESDFNPNCKSRVGACGLMQLMPNTFEDICQWLDLGYTKDQIMDPQVNIHCGTYYLSRMYKMFGDWELALAAYNAGPGNVQKWLKNDDYTEDGKLVYIPFSETSSHVKKVVKAWEIYENLLKG